MCNGEVEDIVEQFNILAVSIDSNDYI